MAALQHGLPIVGTDGELTDQVLRGSDRALRLVPVARKDLFVDAALRLASQRDERDALGRAGRQLYTEQFDWPVTAHRLLNCLRAREVASGLRAGEVASA